MQSSSAWLVRSPQLSATYGRSYGRSNFGVGTRYRLVRGTEAPDAAPLPTERLRSDCALQLNFGNACCCPQSRFRNPSELRALVDLSIAEGSAWQKQRELHGAALVCSLAF